MSHTRPQPSSARQIQYLQSTGTGVDRPLLAASARPVPGHRITAGGPPPATSAWSVHADRILAAPASQLRPVPRGYEGNMVNTLPLAPQPAENNLSFWLEGLPPGITLEDFYRLVLPGAAFGRVYQVHINQPGYGFDTSAEKLTFFDLNGATNFFDRWCRPFPGARNDIQPLGNKSRRLPAIPGVLSARQVKVTRHRVPVYDIPSLAGPRHSRVLVFVGTVEKVNRQWLEGLFNHLCKSWEVEHWEEGVYWRFYGSEYPRRVMMIGKMTVRFGSYRCQAQTIWQFFHSRLVGPDDPEDKRSGVACGCSNTVGGIKKCSQGLSSELEAHKSEGSRSVDIGINPGPAVSSCPSLSSGTTEFWQPDPDPESPPTLTYRAETASEKPEFEESPGSTSSAHLITLPSPTTVVTMPSADLVQYREKWNSDLNSSRSLLDFVARRQQCWREAEELRKAWLGLF
ncbi:hypothetical protein QBC40DRAFT_353315 [Triangularia verruculosa]|uniref:Uncharacterized protein n=1 Tax=Triangularia verruculosa TaxID=2587418 RepID=A0AAN6X5L9_9PEZI|nr:hypothetical protein QBC40DRAFT_353315 [Triangularia verruculosa]